MNTSEKKKPCRDATYSSSCPTSTAGACSAPTAITIVKSPNLDALAAGGTLFENAYCNCPICVPSRASFATGRYVHAIGYWDNAFPYRGTPPSWGHRLHDTGHRCDSIGKLHYRGSDDPNGFDNEILPLHVLKGEGDVQGMLRRPPPMRDSTAPACRRCRARQLHLSGVRPQHPRRGDADG